MRVLFLKPYSHRVLPFAAALFLRSRRTATRGIPRGLSILRRKLNFSPQGHLEKLERFCRGLTARRDCLVECLGDAREGCECPLSPLSSLTRRKRWGSTTFCGMTPLVVEAARRSGASRLSNTSCINAVVSPSSLEAGSITRRSWRQWNGV